MRAVALALTLAAGPAAAETPVGPALGAASNFGQGWQADMFEAARAHGIDDLRDAVYWGAVEDAQGRDRFEAARTTWPDRLGAGQTASLTVNNGHPAWQDGETPSQPEAVAAFARFAAALAARFAQVGAIEVGNEMNSDAFVSGAAWTGALEDRAAAYARLLEATATAVRAARPEARILGGAPLGIPVAWIEAILEAGAAAHMDALVIHPYTTAPEELGGQIGVLRDRTGLHDMPIEVTEFGTQDAPGAPSMLVRHYCKMALAGVTRAVWYPLNPRGDGYAPLIGTDLELTPVGRAWRLLADRAEGRAVADIAPDPFTHGCRFGDDTLVLWGAPRAVEAAPGVSVTGPAGTPVAAAGLTLSREVPLVLRGAGISLGGEVRLAPQTLIADSVDQFAFPGHGADPFERGFRQGGRDHAFETRPGQERNGAPWTPYLGHSSDGIVRAGPDWVLPSAWESGPLSPFLRYRVREAVTADLTVAAAVAERSTDGVVLEVTLNGEVLSAGPLTGEAVLRRAGLALEAGDRIEAVVHPGGSPSGDVTRLRMTLEASQ